MLQINRQTDYAARVILALAKRPPGTRLASGHIQREMLIPKALMPRIVAPPTAWRGLSPGAAADSSSPAPRRKSP